MTRHSAGGRYEGPTRFWDLVNGLSRFQEADGFERPGTIVNQRGPATLSEESPPLGIVDVARDLFRDGYHWEGVFAAAKALVNYVRARSGRHDLAGAALMRTVFSRKDPVLKVNDLADQTDQDEQEGIMHLFEGAVLGNRNPGGHAFPECPGQRAIEYFSLLSLLAYRVQGAKKHKAS